MAQANPHNTTKLSSRRAVLAGAAAIPALTFPAPAVSADPDTGLARLLAELHSLDETIHKFPGDYPGKNLENIPAYIALEDRRWDVLEQLVSTPRADPEGDEG